MSTHNICFYRGKVLIMSTHNTFYGEIEKIAIFTLGIGTPYLLTILVLKFEIVHPNTCRCV